MKQSGFLDINRVTMPMNCAEEAMQWMYEAGLRGVEGVALFAGNREGQTFAIKQTIIPEQTAGDVEGGLIYVVDGDELNRIGLTLYESGLQLFAQIHSHPNEAYHSETDDAYPIVTVAGGISIVVPDFATGVISLSSWAIYRLLPGIGWVVLTQLEKEGFFIIINE